MKYVFILEVIILVLLLHALVQIVWYENHLEENCVPIRNYEQLDR